MIDWSCRREKQMMTRNPLGEKMKVMCDPDEEKGNRWLKLIFFSYPIYVSYY